MVEKVMDLLEEIGADAIVRQQKDINLFEEFLIDSLGFTQLLVGLEERFGIVIAPSEVEKQAVDTPEKIIKLVASRMQMRI